jgi:hypothetical protein
VAYPASRCAALLFLLLFIRNQIGMSKDRMLRLFHADALDLLNITNSLKQVCEDLASPTFRMARKVGGWCGCVAGVQQVCSRCVHLQ